MCVGTHELTSRESGLGDGRDDRGGVGFDGAALRPPGGGGVFGGLLFLCLCSFASHSRGAWHRGECIGRGGCVGQARCQAPGGVWVGGSDYAPSPSFAFLRVLSCLNSSAAACNLAKCIRGLRGGFAVCRRGRCGRRFLRTGIGRGSLSLSARGPCVRWRGPSRGGRRG